MQEAYTDMVSAKLAIYLVLPMSSAYPKFPANKKLILEWWMRLGIWWWRETWEQMGISLLHMFSSYVVWFYSYKHSLNQITICNIVFIYLPSMLMCIWIMGSGNWAFYSSCSWKHWNVSCNICGWLKYFLVSTQVAISVVGLLFFGRLLEPLWGPREFLKFIIVVNFLTSICVFVTAIGLYYATREESYL